jgi:polyisoprenoid-binding protein YceI
MNKLSEYELGTFRKPFVMGVSARGTFKRSAYGMTYGVDNGWVGDEVEMIIEFEAHRQ